VLDAAFGSSGDLVTCGRDKTVRIWSAEGNPLHTFPLESDTAADSVSSGVRVLPLQAVITFDGKAAIIGDSAGRLHARRIEMP
jgi:WD40 repeat protein